MKNPLQTLALALLLPVTAAAQSSLTTTFADNNGRSTSGATTYFDVQLNIGVAIVAFDLNITSAAGLNGTVDVYTTAPGRHVRRQPDQCQRLEPGHEQRDLHLGG